jgi:hypothetical protein
MFIETPFDGPIRGGEDDGSAGAKFGDWRVMDGGAADACMKDCVYELLFDL